MLAEAHAASIGWLAFVSLLVTTAAIGPMLAAVLRHLLPSSRGAPRPLVPLRMGRSLKARRSPRHAVASHRSLLTSLFLTGLGLLLLPLMASRSVLSASGLLVAVAVIGPVLLVSLHSRRRDPGARRNSDA